MLYANFHVMRPHHRVTYIRRQNSLDEPVIDPAGDQRGMGHRINKQEVPVVPRDGATKENAQGLDRADGRVGKGRKRNRGNYDDGNSLSTTGKVVDRPADSRLFLDADRAGGAGGRTAS